ncbi:MAG: alpha/beta fold hydrolase [Actinomycetota bacterium]
MLNIRRFGTGPPIAALHGFSMTGEAFARIAEPLGRTIVAPDLPGHGHSRSHPTDIDSVTAAVDRFLDALVGPLPLLGYSQGGRVALLSTVGDRMNVSCLILISATPGLDTDAERQARVERDHVLAERIRDIGVDSFIDSWTTSGITATDHLHDDHRAWDRTVRSENTAGGLAAALRGYGQGAQPSVWNDLANLTMPVLLVTGGRDKLYTEINERMEQLIPNAELAVIDGAGHNPIADRQDATLESISGFLDRHG